MSIKKKIITPNFVKEFQELVTCREESLKSLKSRQEIEPVEDNREDSFVVKVRDDYWYFDREDIFRVVSKWRIASSVVASSGPQENSHKVLFKELRKRSS